MPVPIARLYILKVFSKFLGLSLFVFISLLLMLNFVQVINQGVLSGFSFYFLAKSMLYLLPNIVGMSLPLAFLLAMLLSLGQMSQDGEIIALRAGGFSFYEILSCVFYAALLASLGVPLLAGWSRKSSLAAVSSSSLAQVAQLDIIDRMVPSVTAAVLAVDRGARVVRVHDVRETVQALKVWVAATAPQPTSGQVGAP